MHLLLVCIDDALPQTSSAAIARGHVGVAAGDPGADPRQPAQAPVAVQVAQGVVELLEAIRIEQRAVPGGEELVVGAFDPEVAV